MNVTITTKQVVYENLTCIKRENLDNRYNRILDMKNNTNYLQFSQEQQIYVYLCYKKKLFLNIS